MKLKIIVLSFIVSCSSLFSAQLQITNSSMSGGLYKLAWTHNQTNYIVQYRTSLVSGAWLNVTNLVLSTNYMTITNWNPSCYYRVKKVNVLDFPDTKFRGAVIAQITNKFYPTNQIYDIDNLSSIISLNVNSKGITNVVGINNLINLQNFNAVSNSITFLDFSGITKLKNVNCSHNLITNIVAAGVIDVINLNYNKIKDLLITNDCVRELHCDNNGMTNIYSYGINNMTSISCCNNNLGYLIELWNDYNLSSLYMTGNPSLGVVTYWSRSNMTNLHVDAACTAVGENP